MAMRWSAVSREASDPSLLAPHLLARDLTVSATERRALSLGAQRVPTDEACPWDELTRASECERERERETTVFVCVCGVTWI